MHGSGGAEESEAFLGHVAWLYFANEMTQAEIASQLGTTRLRVNKAIAAARRRGIVRVEITSPFGASLDLQEKIRERFSLSGAHVAPASRKEYDCHLTVGTALAFFLDAGLGDRQWKSIGVSWGMTLRTAIDRLGSHNLPDMNIVSMIGGTARGASFSAFGIAASFAEHIGANYSLFAAPIYVDTNKMRQSLMESGLFSDQLERARKVDIAIIVAGDSSGRSFLVRDGLPSDVRSSDLVKCGAVGDILGRFLDKDGNQIDHPVNERAIGISLDDLHRIPHVVLAAAGPHKIDIIKAAIRGGHVQTLITDDVTAELLVKE